MRTSPIPTRFAVGIRIVSAQPIAFPVTPHPALVFVALVTGDVDDRARQLQLPDCLQEVGRAHDVRRICLEWVVVGISDNRLGGQVDDDFWLLLRERSLQGLEIAYVA